MGGMHKQGTKIKDKDELQFWDDTVALTWFSLFILVLFFLIISLTDNYYNLIISSLIMEDIYILRIFDMQIVDEAMYLAGATLIGRGLKYVFGHEKTAPTGGSPKE